ncbi:MAG: HEAT repeat domain-containing protein [Calothrix sp. C42_A2020_038]|nr:HEAT repeat domain-containing protein [Calothrix sp. C42_A2020_038]
MHNSQVLLKVDNINRLLAQALIARDAADWSSLNQYLQQLTLENSLNHPKIFEHQDLLLELALLILEFGDFQQRWEVTKVFTCLGSVAIPALIEILSDDTADYELRWYAVRILGKLKNTEAIPILIELIQNDDDEELRSMASVALGQLGSKAILSLSQMLEQENTRLLATQALCYIRTKEIILPLLSVTLDSQVGVRAAAIEALSSFQDPRVLPALLRALNDTDAQVRREAVQGLGFRRDLNNSDVVTLLQPKLYDFDLGVACAAAVSLSRIGGDIAASQLYHLLVSQAPLKLQIEAIRALSWIGNAFSLELLRKALYQIQSPMLCEQIVVVLGRVQQLSLARKAADILLEILHQHPGRSVSCIRSAIALSLGQLGLVDTVEALTLLLADSSTQVRLHALAALKNLAPEKDWENPTFTQKSS